MQEDTVAMQTMTAATLVADARTRIENLSPAQVADELAEGDTVLIDIREADERMASGTIAGAVHAPRGMLEFYADPTGPYYRPEFHPDRRIILHCASGGRSALAAASLQEMGYRNVAHLDGGLKLWKEQGLPVSGV
jgi:rhodanese-related sulfurtransferase